MAFPSPPDLLVRHALRLRGLAEPAAIAGRFGLDEAEVRELLLDDEARGWVYQVGYAGLSGWALTAAGHAEHSRRLAAELAAAGVRPVLTAVHREFGPLHARFLAAVAHWQVRPSVEDPFAENDHRDYRWDERVLFELYVLVGAARVLCERLESSLERFAGYADRLAAALRQADRGKTAWLDRLRSDSLHGVWFELQEDLRASLQLEPDAAG